MKILVIDYGAGNLRSVLRAVRLAGGEGTVSENPDELLSANAVIMPGVGSAADTMRNLAERGLAGPLKDYIGKGGHFFGICMGLQALFDMSEEGGDHPCLGVLPGRVRRFSADLKVPHMGWNRVRFVRSHPMFEGVKDGSFFYFVHSYFPEPQTDDLVVSVTDYGISFPAAVADGNIFATQFHPEKSANSGLQLYRNFLRIAARSPVVPRLNKLS